MVNNSAGIYLCVQLRYNPRIVSRKLLETSLNIHAYLERINYRGALIPNADTLRELQLAHLLAVPFENLSVIAREPIVLDLELLFDKIVLRRRGGFCYELNGLFAWLLRELGFDVAMLSAGVAKAHGGFGPEFDHLTLLVTLEQRWLVDVGFGDSFRLPLLLDKRDVQTQDDDAFQIEPDGDYLVLKNSDRNGDWRTQYRFTLNAHQLSDYAEMCHYHQTSPQTTFTQRRICSLAKPNGRITLSDMRLIETNGHERQERVIADEIEYMHILANEFGIALTRLNT